MLVPCLRKLVELLLLNLLQAIQLVLVPLLKSLLPSLQLSLSNLTDSNFSFLSLLELVSSLTSFLVL